MKRFLVIWILTFIALSIISGQDYYTVKKLRSVSNSIYDQRAPILLLDSLLIYISTQGPEGPRKITDQEGKDFFYLRIASEKKDTLVDIEIDENLREQFGYVVEKKLGAGPPSVALNDSLMICPFYYRNENSRSNNPSIGLFFAYRIDQSGKSWKVVKPFEYNDPLYELYSPYLTPNGDTLYFSANFEDAIGSYDIYVSYENGNKWSKPKNLGPSINTAEIELYPFYFPTGRLFFSSNGFSRRGDFDIMQSDYREGKWTPAEKLVYKNINTSRNEYAFRMADNLKNGYCERRGATVDIWVIETEIPIFQEPQKFKSNYHRRFLLKDNRLDKDSIDPELYNIAWIINDTVSIPEVETIYTFPGPGTYHVRFEVYDKLLDSTKVILDKQQVVSYRTQVAISCPDTVKTNETFRLSGKETTLPGFEIDQFYWDFGDLIKAEGIETSHAYKYPGTYRIVLGVKQKPENKKDVPELRSNYKDIVVIPR